MAHLSTFSLLFGFCCHDYYISQHHSPLHRANRFSPVVFPRQSDSAVEEVPPPELCVEEVWCGAEGPASIAELALEQRGVHFPLVQHHYLLASLLHAAMTFGLRVKPLSLFDSKVSLGARLNGGLGHAVVKTRNPGRPSQPRA